ncbi:DUF4179 domain-containing protein [Anaerobacillus alkaliphilus]|uniref:DUF4179 domain-containing protein n=1 Tax=Anaerobacillus alkaliphilus TaxID=1548597 RepID=A0A4Q0VYZ2_9BACI|nr:DUF4179 domain-containing protein [Anaerobacillus alkaliphilus]RXJ04582.1 DUF4179 domain-containing protein [Anaerobacillus alkaliphilus]
MKDIYELLNDANMDESDFEEMEVSDLEKARVKKALRKSIRKKRALNWKKGLLATSIVFGLTTTTIGFTFPTYASQIPIIGDIFRFFDEGKDGLYTNYKEFSNELNLSQESNGVQVTINDAIFDGKTVTVTYSIDSDKDLGDLIVFDHIHVKGSDGAAGSSQVTKVADNHYVGIMTSSVFGLNNAGTANVKWNVKELKNLETGEEIKGNWNFAFSLQATESSDYLIDQSTENNGVKVAIEKVTITPMSFIVYYDQEVSDVVNEKWHSVDVELVIKDEFGNTYTGQGNGGTGDIFNNISWSSTFEKMGEDATKLIITPHVTFRSYNEENHGGVEFTDKGPIKLPILTKQGQGTEKFDLDEIVIELNK